MGLQADLNLPPVKPNFVQKAIQRIAASDIGIALFSRTIGPIDRLAHKLTRGRITLSRAFGGFPVVMLSTSGAKTGRQRVNPVTAVPHGDDLALVASNFGRDTSPGWAHNLRANPTATLGFGDRQVPVHAVEVAGTEHEDVFKAALAVYPGYARYRRITDRVIPIFILSTR